MHSTYAWILVDIDASKGLPIEINLCSHVVSWTQSLDYEGLPFRCRQCFNTEHVAAKCEAQKTNLRNPPHGGRVL